MFYSPLLDLYFKYEKHIHDFFVQLAITIIVYLLDSFAVYVLQYNTLLISFLAFMICYVAARVIIRASGKQKLFGNFVNWSIHYCIFLAMFAWFVYLLFIRLQRFQ